MSNEQIIKIVKYLVVAWLVLSVIFGAAYLTMLWIVLELFSQFGELAK